MNTMNQQRLKNKVTKDTSSKPTPGGVNRSLKSLEQKRKQVYKPVLDNPYIRSNNWPYIDQNLGADLTELLCKYLEPIGKYKKYKTKSESSGFTMEEPDILSHTTLGFNSTNKALEEMSKFNRGQLKKEPQLKLAVVFVCKVDITPTLLTQHLPVLSYMASNKEFKVKLVQLPRNSMDKISKALESKNVGIIGISDDSTGINVLKNLVFEKVEDVKIEWLENLNFQVPNIKLLVTTQPIALKKNDQKKLAKEKNKTQGQQKKQIDAK